MSKRATKTACFKPNNYEELSLFADRTSFKEDLFQTIASQVNSSGPGEHSIMVRGDRGIGKSILVREVLRQIRQEYGPLLAIVDCAIMEHSAEHMMRQLAVNLADQAIQNSNNENLRREAELLRRVAQTTRLKAREVRTWSSSLRLGGEYKCQLLSRVQFEFGIQNSIARTRELEETYERNIDTTFLQEILREFICDCKESRERVVLLIDNLDQVGYPELIEDAKRVTDLARYVFSLRKCIVISTIRTEFVSADLHRLASIVIEIPGMLPEELKTVASKRIRLASQEYQQALHDAGFEELIHVLTKWTNNPWSLLVWLESLDYSPLDANSSDPQSVQRALTSLIQPHFSVLKVTELLQIARPYSQVPAGFLTEPELKLSGFSDDLFKRAVRCRALVPDFLLGPERYFLSPWLYFLTKELES